MKTLGPPGITVLGKRPPSPKFEEIHARRIIDQCAQMLATSGGQAPIVDPVVVVIIGTLIDKIDALERKIDKLANNRRIGIQMAEADGGDGN